MNLISFRRAYCSGLLALSAAAMLAACSEGPGSATVAQLPYVGEPEVRLRTDGGRPDSIYPTIPEFRLTNQENQPVTNATFAGKVYVTDFFFATCPSICPKMQSELLRVYERFSDDPRVMFLSHTIDPVHDSIPVLRDYAERLGIKNAQRWHFATAPHDTIFRLARLYMTAAQKDASVKGGYAHSGTFALIDSQRHIRGVYDGMNPQEVDRLMQELPVLLKEEATRPTAAAPAASAR